MKTFLLVAILSLIIGMGIGAYWADDYNSRLYFKMITDMQEGWQLGLNISDIHQLEFVQSSLEFIENDDLEQLQIQNCRLLKLHSKNLNPEIFNYKPSYKQYVEDLIVETNIRITELEQVYEC